MNKNLLALGIPTFNRPDFAIKLIADVINLNVYDEIIVSCNSKEMDIERYLSNLDSGKNVIYNLQEENIGLCKNYGDIIKLSKCKYIHIISDEDSVNYKNTKDLYKFIEDSQIKYGIICLSVIDEFGKIYKDASIQKNNHIKNICSDTGHIGSFLINIEQWKEKSINLFSDYAERLGSVYPTTASAIIAYLSNPNIAYYPKHIVKMGTKHKKSEIRGHNIYGFSSRGYQFMSLIDLVISANILRCHQTIIYMIYFFSSHAFIDSHNKFKESVFASSLKCLKCKDFSITSKVFLIISIILFYFFRIYRFLRLLITSTLKTFLK